MTGLNKQHCRLQHQVLLRAIKLRELMWVDESMKMMVVAVTLMINSICGMHWEMFRFEILKTRLRTIQG
jgi:hypothetical protein